MYRVIVAFNDLQNDGQRYEVGDVFPKENVLVSDERFEELATTKNRRRIVLIEKVEEKADDNVKVKNRRRNRNK